MDLSAVRSAYLIGIKGVGMTAFAQVLRAWGVDVFGSDIAQHFFTDDVLRRAGIPFTEGFAVANVPATVDLVVRSTAYAPGHPEVDAAMERGLPVVTLAEAVAMVFNAGKGIAVCGSHGKTTTTAMLGYVLQEAGLDPTVMVGSDVPQFGGCARVGQSDLVVLEADEYQDKLAHYAPHGIILTSIDYDHPDFFPTPEAYVDAFRRFVRRLPPGGFLIACADDPVVCEVAREAPCRVVWYPGDPADQKDGEVKDSPGRGRFRVVPPPLTPLTPLLPLLLPGRHNIQNALGVLAAAEHLGVTRDVALRALASFQGTRRRFETVGVVRHSMSDNGEIVVIDDYGHHPTEVHATLAAARERYPGRRILCAFHPHTFTRTIALKDGFARAFGDADRTFVMDIFGSARELPNNFSPFHREGEREGEDSAHRAAEQLAAVIAAHSPAIASGNVEQTVAALARDVRPGDVVLCMGAGENDRVARALVAQLTHHTPVQSPRSPSEA